jgi:hypothetical protein
VPDAFDYEWLGWLISHPDEWTPTDLASAESLVANQVSAIEESHPKDVRGSERLQAVVDQLETAIQEYRRRQG